MAVMREKGDNKHKKTRGTNEEVDFKLHEHMLFVL